MSDTLEIISAISQVATQLSHDGALDKDGEKVEIGLKREEGNPLTDRRVMDGFGVKFSGDKLIITYNSEVSLKDVHEKGFESDIESMINDISKFLKKEYKKVTGNSLSLTATKEPVKVLVQSVSRIRSWVQAEKEYKIGGIEEQESEESKLDSSVKKWLELGKNQKKPENVKIKPSDNEAPKPYKKKSLKENR